MTFSRAEFSPPPRSELEIPNVKFRKEEAREFGNVLQALSECRLGFGEPGTTLFVAADICRTQSRSGACERPRSAATPVPTKSEPKIS